MSRVLSLSSGGTYGAFEAGVVEALVHEHRLDWDAFYGSSAGALNAAFLSCFTDIREGTRELCLFWQRVAKIWRAPRIDWCSAVTAFCSGRASLNSSETLERILNEMPLQNVATRKLYIVATREADGAPVMFTFTRGDIERVKIVLRASTAIPLVWDPVKIKNTLYTDGTVVMPIPYPTEITERMMVSRIDFVVTPPNAINFLHAPKLFDVAAAATQTISNSLSDAELEAAQYIFGNRAFLWASTKRQNTQRLLGMASTAEIIQEGRDFVMNKKIEEHPHRLIPIVFEK